ncbi:MAG: glycosyl hydrolase 53 family protein [Bacteroidota bacterium]
MKYIRVIILLIASSKLIAQTPSQEFIRGADISFTQQIEFRGGKYKLNGVEKEILDILQENGANYIRLRLWHTPSNGYNSLSKTLQFAQRIKSKGLKFLLDFHYSDTWADPSNQTKPYAWRNLPFENLKDSVYEYTKRVITLMKNQNTLPDIVQIGNEVAGGMLWPDGKLYGAGNETVQWDKFSELVKEGVRGVRDAADTSSVKIMIHIEKGGDYSGSVYFFDRLTARNVEFDIIGLSYYPWYHGSLSQLQSNLNSLAVRYQKEIVVVETAYPWTLDFKDNTNNIVGLDSQLLPGYPATEEGQKNFLTQIKNIVKQTTNNKGLGFFYWEPGYISLSNFGSSWENCALFDFSNEATDAIMVFNDSTGTSVDDDISQVPTEFYLYQNYPNPFNPSTTIEYSITNVETTRRVVFTTLKVFDILGREVATLVNEYQQPGKYSVVFNVETRHQPRRDRVSTGGESLPSGVSAKGGYASGVYFYTLMIRDTSLRSVFYKTKKMLLIK